MNDATILYRRADAARKVGCHPDTLSRFAAKHGIGIRGTGVFTQADVDRLKGLIRGGQRGNPKLIAGSKYPGKISRKGWKMKPNRHKSKGGKG